MSKLPLKSLCFFLLAYYRASSVHGAYRLWLKSIKGWNNFRREEGERYEWFKCMFGESYYNRHILRHYIDYLNCPRDKLVKELVTLLEAKFNRANRKYNEILHRRRSERLRDKKSMDLPKVC